MKPLDFNDTLLQLIEIQKTDSGLDELEKMIRNYTKEIGDYEGNLAGLKEKLVSEKKAFEELAKARKTLEIEAGSLETKIQKYLGQQNDVKSNEQFTALKDEIEKSRQEKAQAEEKTLEILFKEDEQKITIQATTKKVADEEKRVADEKKIIQQKIDDCEKAAQEKRRERAEQLPKIESVHALSYESLRTHGKKIAVAYVKEDDTCSGCNMSVAPQILNEIRKNIGIQRCSCGRYLYHKD
jgi:predicted  nucleic acid-binding Zn-ribbon protein